MKHSSEKPRSLHSETLRLLLANEKSLLDVHAESGVAFYWLRKFKEGSIRNPSVNTVQTLYEYLTGRALEV